MRGLSCYAQGAQRSAPKVRESQVSIPEGGSLASLDLRALKPLLQNDLSALILCVNLTNGFGGPLPAFLIAFRFASSRLQSPMP
jgi:hypothetical protein